MKKLLIAFVILNFVNVFAAEEKKSESISTERKPAADEKVIAEGRLFQGSYKVITTRAGDKTCVISLINGDGPSSVAHTAIECTK